MSLLDKMSPPSHETACVRSDSRLDRRPCHQSPVTSHRDCAACQRARSTMQLLRQLENRNIWKGTSLKEASLTSNNFSRHFYCLCRVGKLRL
jgi:hypothetical protein